MLSYKISTLSWHVGVYQQFLPSFLLPFILSNGQGSALWKREKEWKAFHHFPEMFNCRHSCQKNRDGLPLGSLWAHFGFTLGSLWACSGLVMGSILTHSELAPGTFRAHSGFDRLAMGSFIWARSGLVQSYCSACSGLDNRIEMASGSFLAQSELNPGTTCNLALFLNLTLFPGWLKNKNCWSSNRKLRRWRKKIWS